VQNIDIEAVRAVALSAAESVTFGRRQGASRAAMVRAMRAEISAWRARGATWAQVAEILDAAGVSLKAESIRAAMRGTRVAARRVPIRKTAPHAVEPAVPTPETPEPPDAPLTKAATPSSAPQHVGAQRRPKI